jgi:hypothetical protein
MSLAPPFTSLAPNLPASLKYLSLPDGQQVQVNEECQHHATDAAGR